MYSCKQCVSSCCWVEGTINANGLLFSVFKSFIIVFVFSLCFQSITDTAALIFPFTILNFSVSPLKPRRTQSGPQQLGRLGRTSRVHTHWTTGVEDITRLLLVVIAPKLETTQKFSHKWWINKLWYIHGMEYYIAPTSNEPLVHATTWINLTILTMNERSQTKECILYMHCSCL